MIVVWRIVDSCNLSCPFCAFDKRLAFPRAQAAQEEILRFASVLADYKAKTSEPVLLSWLGGEPLRWRPLEAVTRAVRTLGLDVSATTNGSTLGNRHLRDFLCREFKELTVSVDGFAELHNAMRGWPGGFDKLKLWVSTLAQEARNCASTIKLKANIVLMHQNVRHFRGLCMELTNWGVSEITYNQLGGRDRPEFYPAHRLTCKDVDLLEAQLEEIRGELSDRGVILVGGSDYLDRIRASALNVAIPVQDCQPGEKFLFIDEAGQISPCSFTTSDYGIDIRTVRTESDLAALPNRFRNLRNARRSNNCEDCLSTQVCGKFDRDRLLLRQFA